MVLALQFRRGIYESSNWRTKWIWNWKSTAIWIV